VTAKKKTRPANFGRTKRRQLHFLYAKGKQRRADMSEREMEVLQLLIKSRSNKEIGSSLFVCEDTVKAHLKSLLAARSGSAAFRRREHRMNYLLCAFLATIQKLTTVAEIAPSKSVKSWHRSFTAPSCK
jgi:DNA-binding CsgD family transcriptional regulator